MMKKNGFTLAEVLITLAIIGVVATLTLPALMTNTNEQQSIAGLKKGINTLTEAAQMNSALEGFDYSGLVNTEKKTTDEVGNAQQSLYGLITTRASVDVGKSGTGKGWRQNGSSNTTNFVIYFRDGACISFNPAATSTVITSSHGSVAKDGIKIVYDVNGNKSPNILSNCAKKPAGQANDIAQGSNKLEDVCVKENRVIKDQFGVVLTGGYALPNGPAARWAVAQ